MEFVAVILGVLVPFTMYAMSKAKAHRTSYDYIHDKAVYEVNQEMESEGLFKECNDTIRRIDILLAKHK